MGLIKAAAGAVGGMMADQWKEFFVCDAIDDDVLVVKGSKQASGRSSNTKGESNVISDGSAVSVADGQCMMIVEQGRVIELSAEPGIFIYKNDLSPSIFAGNLKDAHSRELQRMPGIVLNSEAVREKIRESITSTPRNCLETNTARSIPSRSKS